MASRGAVSLARSSSSSVLKDKSTKKVSARKLLMQLKAEQVQAEASAALLFHCSGVNCKQWRELKNAMAPIQGKSLFQPNFKRTDGAAGAFAAKISASPGPLCLLYLGKGTSPDLLAKLLPPSSMSDSMLLLYGQQQSTVLNHVDIKKASSLDLHTVYRRSVFSTLFSPMGFLSGLDRITAAAKMAQNDSAEAENPEASANAAS